VGLSFAITRRFQKNPAQFPANRMRERDVRHDAASKKRVFKTVLGAVEKLVNEHNVARFIFLLQRTDRADADDPGNAELFHRPDVGAMVQLARQNAVTASMSGQKNHIASGQPAREQIIRWRTEWCFDLHPFLVREAFNVVKSRAADDSNAMLRHAQLYSIDGAKSRQCFSRLAFENEFANLCLWKLFTAF
jgi:hypothetical protein